MLTDQLNEDGFNGGNSLFGTTGIVEQLGEKKTIFCLTNLLMKLEMKLRTTRPNQLVWSRNMTLDGSSLESTIQKMELLQGPTVDGLKFGCRSFKGFLAMENHSIWIQQQCYEYSHDDSICWFERRPFDGWFLSIFTLKGWVEWY